MVDSWQATHITHDVATVIAAADKLPTIREQLAPEIVDAVDAKLNEWFGTELGGYAIEDVLLLGRHVI